MRLLQICFLISFLFVNDIVAFQLESLNLTTHSCDKAKANYENRFKKLQKAYLKIDQQKIENRENQPVWIDGHNKGSQKIIYFLHGFLASPFELKTISDLFSGSDYTLVRDLIPGHGASAKIANQYGSADFKEHVFANLNDIFNCADEVNFVSFSTGGTTLYSYLQSHPTRKLKSAVFISPFLNPTFFFADFLSTTLSQFTTEAPIPLMYALTRFPDIKVAVKDPDHYLQDLPLIMSDEIVNFGYEVFRTKTFANDQKNSQTQFLLITSAQDSVAHYPSSHFKFKHDFPEKIEIIHFPFLSFAPHHLMALSVSPVADEVADLVYRFILR